MDRIDLGTVSARRSYIYALLVGFAALLWVGGIVSYAGNALPGDRDRSFFRYCGGKCLCDGGVANAALMARVCPEGWEEAYGVARSKLRRVREIRRKARRLRQQASPPPIPPSGPNV